ncbi:MAG TPA: ABC transporter permease [Stellaceae bacterium]|nr:ABC transporter permease [Stellaceae bacterium]
MTTIDPSSALVAEAAPFVSRKTLVMGGRIALALGLLLAWQWGAMTFGTIFFAYPVDVFWRIIAIARSGELAEDILTTLRVSSIGFVIGCVAGVALPFLLRRSPRWTAAVEPYILASQGIPKYALAPWLILWFGIGDLPKLVIVTLMVFYIPFVNTFAGIRGVDQRFVNMARIMGANEVRISREVIWNSLLPFFFTSLKVSLPRAVSACIVGEFLVSTAGVGHYIEHAREISDTVGVFAGIIVATALVLIVNAFVERLERHALRWRPTDRDMVL